MPDPRQKQSIGAKPQQLPRARLRNINWVVPSEDKPDKQVLSSSETRGKMPVDRVSDIQQKQSVGNQPQSLSRARLRNINWTAQPEDRPDEKVLVAPRHPRIPVFPSVPTRVDLSFVDRVNMSIGMPRHSVYVEPNVVLYSTVEKTDQQIQGLLSGEYFRVFIVTAHQDAFIAEFQLEGAHQPEVYLNDSVTEQVRGDAEYQPEVHVEDKTASDLQLGEGDHSPEVHVGDNVTERVQSEGEHQPRIQIGDAVSMEQLLAPGEHIPIVVIADAVSEMVELSDNVYFLKLQVQEALENVVASIGLGSNIYGNPWLTQDDQPWRTQDNGVWEAN